MKMMVIGSGNVQLSKNPGTKSESHGMAFGVFE
jgi:hypothetical protein